MVPITLTLATAICWRGWTSAPARTSRLARIAVAWVTMSIWPSPTESSQSCHGLRIVGMSFRSWGIVATNSPIEVASAPATSTMTTTSTRTTAV